jgi:hypothetical protein
MPSAHCSASEEYFPKMVHLYAPLDLELGHHLHALQDRLFATLNNVEFGQILAAQATWKVQFALKYTF